MLEQLSPTMSASMCGLTFREYVANCQTHRKLLQTRYSEARLTPEAQDYFINYPDALQWVVIVDEENPDTIAILPILQHVANCSTRFNLFIVPAEHDFSHLEGVLDDADLGDDLAEMEFPLLLLFDEEWNFHAFCGPRPEAADVYLEQWLEDNPDYEALATDDSPDSQQAYLELLAELTQVMRVWYNSGLEATCMEEICALLETFQEHTSSE